jgi:vacuolar-type H+-ATPase subunit F/Vma7
MKIVYLGPEALHLGFASAGAECLSAPTGQETLDRISSILTRDDIGILLIATSYFEGIRQNLDHLRTIHALPLILEISDLERQPPSKTDEIPALMAKFGMKGGQS